MSLAYDYLSLLNLTKLNFKQFLTMERPNIDEFIKDNKSNYQKLIKLLILGIVIK